MQTSQDLNQVITDRIVFLQQFLKRPQQVGSITPSSRFLERRIVKLADIASARVVVELGGGTGGTTRALLRALSPTSTLLTIEINPQFCELLGRIDDKRLAVHHGAAHDLKSALAAKGQAGADAVISGIPFSTMPREAGLRVISAIWTALRPGGRFVAYQVSNKVAELATPTMGPTPAQFEILNIPPMRLYRWDKRASDAVC